MLPSLPDDRFHYDAGLNTAVTAKHTHIAPLHNWFVFPHSFSPQLVHYLLDALKVPEDGLIYDPFVGAGTTLLACKEREISAVGSDLLPLAVFVSNVKVQDYDAKALSDELHTLSFAREPKRPTYFADIPIVARAFDDATIRQTSLIYELVQRIAVENHRNFFLLVLLSILNPLSRTARDGGWLRLLESAKYGPNDVIPTFIARAENMINQLESSAPKSKDGLTWQAFLSDARAEEPRLQADAVISSPPYLNRHDYTRIFSLELALAFVEDHEALKRIRYNSLRSHVEARAITAHRSDYYRPPLILEKTMKELSSRLKDVRVQRMIAGYFEDIHQVLSALRNKVRLGGKVGFVLGNTRYAGIVIPVDEIVARLGETVGFTLERIIVARYRGNSAQQMGRYGRVPVRESVIVWRR